MAYKVIILYRLYMPSYVLGTFTEYPCLIVFNISHKYFYASNSLLLDNRHEPMTHA